MVGIELQGVNLKFRVRQQKTFKDFLLKSLWCQKEQGINSITALRDLDLRIHDGERVGIIGGNGSGKSTLLKLLAGIYYPNAGTRKVMGRISSLFELYLGFEMEATGWKNILFRGYLQGESPQSLRRKIQEIADFSELGEFLEVPMRHYSAGMLVRLAFSIATAIDPEILLIDEVLFAVDLAFQHKARERIQQMMSKARIMVVVSHELESLPKFCDRALWIDQGRIRLDGPVGEVIAAYTEHVKGKRALAA